MPNAHVQAYLTSYLSIDDPGYAVLITAPWGAGKTHLVKAFMDDALYVSLFGVTNSDDINRAILMARLPVLDNHFTKSLGQFGVAAMKYFKLPEIAPNDFARLALPKTLIFDDLERTNMPVQELTGYLNSFVEHEGKKRNPSGE